MRPSRKYLIALFLLKVNGQSYSNNTSIESVNVGEWLENYQLFNLELNTNTLPELPALSEDGLKTALQASANGDIHALNNYFVEYFVTKYNARVKRKGFFAITKEVSSFDFKADLTDIRFIDNNAKDKTTTAVINVAENELGSIRGIRIIGPSDKVKVKRERDGKYHIEVNEVSDSNIKLEPILTALASKKSQSSNFDWFNLSGKTGNIDFQIEPKDLKYNRNSDSTISLMFGNVRLTSTSNQFKVSQTKDRKLNVHVEDISKIKIDHNVISNRDIDWFNLKRSGTLEFTIKSINLKNQPNSDGTLTLIFRDVKLTGKEADISMNPGIEERVIITIKNVERIKVERIEAEQDLVNSSEHLLLMNLPRIKGIVQINPTDPFSVTTSTTNGFIINFAGFSIKGSPSTMGVARTGGNQIIVYFKDTSQIVVEQRPDASSFSRVSGRVVISAAGKASQQFKFVSAELEAIAPATDAKPGQNEVEVMEQPKIDVKDSSHFDFSQISMYSTPVQYEITDPDSVTYTQNHDLNGLTSIMVPGFVIVGSTQDITIKATTSRISFYFKKPNKISIRKAEIKSVEATSSKDSEYTKEKTASETFNSLDTITAISTSESPSELSITRTRNGGSYSLTDSSKSTETFVAPTKAPEENEKYIDVDLSTLIPADDFQFILLEKQRRPAEFKVKEQVKILDNQDGTKTVIFSKFRFTVLPDDFAVDKLSKTLTRVKFLQPRSLNIVPDTPDSIQFKDMNMDLEFLYTLKDYENPIKIYFSEVDEGITVFNGGVLLKLKELSFSLQSELDNMVYTAKENNSAELAIKNPSLVRVTKL